VEFSAPPNRLVTSPTAARPSTGAPLLELAGITRRFGAVVALDDATFAVRAGTVHAVLGENGAGKTTLMRVAFGLLSPDRGTVRVRGVETTLRSPAAAMHAGIGMVHQHFTLVPAMTVAENVALGGHGVFDPTAAAARVREVGKRAGLVLDPLALVNSLSVGAQQRCEIVKALARDVNLLILDEPTAVLAPQEAAELLRWMRAFADQGHAVVLITHKLRDALAVADDVTVLRRGRTVLSARAAETSQDALRLAMVGGDLLGGFARDDTLGGELAPTARAAVRTPRGAIVVEARDVHFVEARGTTRVRDVSLAVCAGEIVGIAGVEGSGQHELLRLLAGRLEPTRGTITGPERAGFVPEDRHRDALMLDATLSENVALRGAGSRRGRMPWRALRAATTLLLQARDVRAGGIGVLARTLSGGNQQKLVLARELADTPAAVIVENPSRGLDFQATAAVQAALHEARDAGAAVVLYSSDLDEVLLLADRVFVMYDGRLIETARDRDAVGRAMLGSA
jgi:general nucleoside transport system ATP-binding protein